MDFQHAFIERGNEVVLLRLKEFPEDYVSIRAGSGDTAEIYDIAIYSRRSVGRGRTLMEEACRYAKEVLKANRVFAITRLSNINAHKFYLAIGFQNLGSLQSFYGTEKAIVFGRTL